MFNRHKNYIDHQKIDIAKPVEHKKLAITSEIVIGQLVLLIIMIIIKVVIVDGLLFNTSMELDIIQRNIAIIFAKLTKVPEQSINFNDIDTTNIMTMVVQILEIFIVNPLINYAELIINRELDKLFQTIQPII